MNDIATLARQAARAVLAFPFDPATLASNTNREAVEAAISEYRKVLIPANRLTKAERLPDQQRLADLLRSIGLRIRPDFSEDQAKMWIAAMVEALENLPLRVALAATRDAIHKPIGFPGEVHRVIADLAEEHDRAYRRAILNLERTLRFIDRPRALEASPEAKAEADRLSDEELQTMPSPLKSIGLHAGWLIETPNGIRWATDQEQAEQQQRPESERGFARARDATA